MSRRGMNIYKRKDGRWEGRIQKGKIGGTRHYQSVYGTSYAEVKKKMECMKKNNLADEKGEGCTLGEAAEIWTKERGQYWKKTTYATYQNILRKYVLPKFGNVAISHINEAHIEGFLLEICEEKELSNSYLHNICAVIARIMKHMKRRHGYKIEIPENDISLRIQGRRDIPEEKDLSLLEQYLMGHVKEKDHTCLGILVALNMGLRIGETSALTWECIDLEKEVIFVQKNLQRVKTADGPKNITEILVQSPKTDYSRRAIPIPPPLLPLLKQQKEEGGNYLIKGKKKPWAEPRTLQYRFARILEECGLTAFNFHMLRHAFATRCIEKGFDVKSLSEILGHSNTQTTLNLYVHSSMPRKKELMGQFQESFYPSRQPY